MKRKPLLITNFEARSVMLIASWTLGVAGVAYAQNTRPSNAAATDRDVSAAFREADKNADGYLNREEALVMPSVSTNFEQIDTNKDNNISLDELAKAVQK